MCDINTGKRGDVAIINTNVTYNFVERCSTGNIGGRVGGREDGGEDNHEYEVVGTSCSGLASQQTGESSFGRGGGGNIYNSTSSTSYSYQYWKRSRCGDGVRQHVRRTVMVRTGSPILIYTQ